MAPDSVKQCQRVLNGARDYEPTFIGYDAEKGPPRTLEEIFVHLTPDTVLEKMLHNVNVGLASHVDAATNPLYAPCGKGEMIACMALSGACSPEQPFFPFEQRSYQRKALMPPNVA